MLVSLLDAISGLDNNQKNTIYDMINKFINPIKIYLIFLILILLFILGSNVYLNINMLKHLTNIKSEMI